MRFTQGFTQTGSRVTYPGTYRGIGEMAPYLADLGINAVELMPIHEKPLDGGYWGYNNIHFFAPDCRTPTRSPNRMM